MTDQEFKELSQLKDFCLELQRNPMWGKLCAYMERKRIAPIEKDILNATLGPAVPNYEILCYNDAMSKGKILGIREFIDTVPMIILRFEKELKVRTNPIRKMKNRIQGAGPRKPQ
jgi:hypothetical protein